MKIRPFYRIAPENWVLTTNSDVAAAQKRAMENPQLSEQNIEEYVRQWVLQELIEKIIEEAELIFVSPMCWDEMRKRAPAEKELKTYENFISQETIDYLKELQLLGS